MTLFSHLYLVHVPYRCRQDEWLQVAQLWGAFVSFSSATIQSRWKQGRLQVAGGGSIGQKSKRLEKKQRGLRMCLAV